MSAPGLTVPTVEWEWWWVPAADHDEADGHRWQSATATLFAEWLDDGVRGVASSLPPELREGLDARSVGQEVAVWLRSRALGQPPSTYVAWGAAFLTPDRPRWGPVVALVELREPTDDDPAYLMDLVGASGRPDDARRPLVDYVTTDGGDGVRVSALGREPSGAAHVRVDAALRLDATDARGPVDVLVATRVADLALFGTVGRGVDTLLHRVVADAPALTGTGPVSSPNPRSAP
ncbi:hypothetical protein [Cellulomonas xiejunii]|uniref:Uncharacterized protein n=1 Tax=Cellulomonas xiejunii TaxID=2968083 RepID=A0ABY5KM64_9CELL|nr:hypothetical protein [Cellulomonas xiejunii]MCC2323478.1 hypothetical protein [Cellulomonas xiejunii]UUI71592.1 hypothetical protein NP048_17660 [Cellulomonas xiejunii]